MALIMVTAIDQKTGISYDVEVPDDLEIEKLTDDLIQALNGADPELNWDIYSAYLKKGTNKLEPSKTLRQEGVWNGDYLYICE